MITVMIADDHPLLIEGVASVLDNEPDMQLVCKAGDGREAIAQYRAMLPDVVLMDVQMPQMDGIAATRHIRDLSPSAKVIILTTYRGDVPALSALAVGAQGFLLKSTLRAELVVAIRAVASGKRWIPAQVARALADHAAHEQLTRRELQVLERIAAGHGNKLIASELGISRDTVKAHVKSILAKLQASDRTHAVTTALRRGYMQLSPAAEEPCDLSLSSWQLVSLGRA